MYTAKDLEPYEPYSEAMHEATFKSFDSEDMAAIIQKLNFAADQLQKAIDHKEKAGSAEYRKSLLDQRKYEDYEILACNEHNAKNRIDSARQEIKSAQMNLELFVSHHCK